MCLLTSEVAVPAGSGSAVPDQPPELPQALGQEQNTILVPSHGTLNGRRIPIWIPADQASDPLCAPDADQSDEAVVDLAPKKCFVCFEEILHEDDAHQTLTPECSAHYHHETMSICTDCLRKDLYHKMFPLGQGAGNHKFPSLTVRCYQCYQMVPHTFVQKYADSEAFDAYDRALCQRYLHQNESILKCAFDGCAGAEWTDDPDCADSKVFHCPTCNRGTCLECNGPLENHSGRSCPMGKDARNPMKIRLAETRSKFKLKTKNKCPKCPIRYEKIDGCDHIVCGSKYSGGDFSGGCDYHFCHRCKGPWTRHGHRFYCIWFFWRR